MLALGMHEPRLVFVTNHADGLLEGYTLYILRSFDAMRA
jgi:hypothetical protein